MPRCSAPGTCKAPTRSRRRTPCYFLPHSELLLYSGFRQAVSPERLSTYRSPGETDEAIICRYLWSIALNESLYQPLQFIEIVFRNTLYETIAGRIGSRAWLTARSSILKP